MRIIDSDWADTWINPQQIVQCTETNSGTIFVSMSNGAGIPVIQIFYRDEFVPATIPLITEQLRQFFLGACSVSL